MRSQKVSNYIEKGRAIPSIRYYLKHASEQVVQSLGEKFGLIPTGTNTSEETAEDDTVEENPSVEAEEKPDNSEESSYIPLEGHRVKAESGDKEEYVPLDGYAVKNESSTIYQNQESGKYYLKQEDGSLKELEPKCGDKIVKINPAGISWWEESVDDKGNKTVFYMVDGYKLSETIYKGRNVISETFYYPNGSKVTQIEITKNGKVVTYYDGFGNEEEKIYYNKRGDIVKKKKLIRMHILPMGQSLRISQTRNNLTI